MSDLELKVTRIIPARRKDVFDAWLTPDTLKKFMCPGPGMTCPKAEVDAKVGGSFLIVMAAGENEIPHDGTYEKISEHDEIVFTWNSPFTKVDRSVVTLQFEDEGEGATKLTLHHVGFNDEESRANHEGGWKAIVEKLAAAVS